MRSWIGFAVMVGVWMAVEHWYGPIGGTRLVGAFFAAGSVYYIFVPELPFYFGQHLAATFTGWGKAFLIVPAFCIGCLVMVYGAEITCFSTKHKHLCDGPNTEVKR